MTMQALSIWTDSTVTSIRILNSQAVSTDVAESLMSELDRGFDNIDDVQDIMNNAGGPDMTDDELDAAMAELEPTYPSDYLGIDIPSAASHQLESHDPHGTSGSTRVPRNLDRVAVRRRRNQATLA